jgi:hypothetical protein
VDVAGRCKQRTAPKSIQGAIHRRLHCSGHWRIRVQSQAVTLEFVGKQLLRIGKHHQIRNADDHERNK